MKTILLGFMAIFSLSAFSAEYSECKIEDSIIDGVLNSVEYFIEKDILTLYPVGKRDFVHIKFELSGFNKSNELVVIKSKKQVTKFPFTKDHQISKYHAKQNQIMLELEAIKNQVCL